MPSIPKDSTSPNADNVITDLVPFSLLSDDILEILEEDFDDVEPLLSLDREESNPDDPPSPSWTLFFATMSYEIEQLRESSGDLTDNQIATSLTAIFETLAQPFSRYEAALSDLPDDPNSDDVSNSLKEFLVPTESNFAFNTIGIAELVDIVNTLLVGAYGNAQQTIQDILQHPGNTSEERLSLVTMLRDIIEWTIRQLSEKLILVYRHKDAEYILSATLGAMPQLELQWTYPAVGLWIRNIAQNGERAFLNQRNSHALQEFNRIVLLQDNTVVPGPNVTGLSEYFREPRDAAIDIITQNTDGAVLTTLFSPAVPEAIQQVVSRVKLIDANQDDIAPIWRFDYLYQLTTFFAKQAEQTEQRYIQFEEKRANSALTRQQLSDAVSLARNELSLADARLREHDAAVRVARGRLFSAERRRTAFRAEYRRYLRNSYNAIQHQAMAASLGGGSNGIFSDINRHAEELKRKGRTRGQRGHLIGASTYLAGMEMREVEQQRLANAEARAVDEALIAQRQLEQELKRRDSARTLRTAVQTRLSEAIELERIFADTDLPPEAYQRMAALMQRISNSYLSMAYEIAFLAQQAFNYEFRTSLSIVTAPDDTAAGPDGLLRSTVLQNQIASFKLNEVFLDSDERSFVTWNVKLHELFGASYFDALLSGKPFNFVLEVEMLDKKFPGLVDVKIESLSITTGKPRSVKLTNGFQGQVRGYVPDDIYMTPQNSTDALDSTKSPGDARIQSFIRAQDNRKRRAFEDSSPFCAWRLEIIDDTPTKLMDTTLDFSLSGVFSQEVYDHVMRARRIEERVLPVPLTDIVEDATEQLITNGKVRVSIPFEIQNENSEDPINLFPTEEGLVPILTGLQTVVGLSDPAAEPNTLSTKVKLPLTNSVLPEIQIEKTGGAEWTDNDIPEKQPAVGDFEVTLEGTARDKIVGAALLIRYKIQSFEDSYINSLSGKVSNRLNVSLIFRRPLLLGSWTMMLEGNAIVQTNVEDEGATLLELTLPEELSEQQWEQATLVHDESNIEISLAIS